MIYLLSGPYVELQKIAINLTNQNHTECSLTTSELKQKAIKIKSLEKTSKCEIKNMYFIYGSEMKSQGKLENIFEINDGRL